MLWQPATGSFSSRVPLDSGVVERVLPRRNFLARPYSPDQGVISDLKQIIVANVDRVLIVASWLEPNVWPALIDRYLIAALRYQIEPVICINKVDLVEDRVAFDEFLGVYSQLGYRLIQTSVVNGDGIDDLKELLAGSTFVLAGLSGVGKSSLLMAVQPGLDLKTGNVSEHGLYTGQGRHTTTQSRLLKLDCGGVVADTPGVRSFALDGISPGELADWYPEMVGHRHACRFSDCSHIDEPDCGVKQAVANGEISPLRYKNYTQISCRVSGEGRGGKAMINELQDGIYRMAYDLQGGWASGGSQAGETITIRQARDGYSSMGLNTFEDLKNEG